MRPFWKIFLGIFCYIAAAAGIGLAILNASQKPAATSYAIIFGVIGVVFLTAGIAIARKPRY